MKKNTYLFATTIILASIILSTIVNFAMFKYLRAGEVGGSENYTLFQKLISLPKYADFNKQTLESQINAVNKRGTPGANTPQSPAQALPKTDKPTVELFVMSYCPYGLQAEKGILPTIKALGNSIDFKIKFVSYAMHGEKEVRENLHQYCIQKEEPEKFQSYLACFLNGKTGSDDEIAGCVKTAGVNVAKISSCVSSSDKQFAIMKNFTDTSTWNGKYPMFNTDKQANVTYGVQGSPTLVINGVTSRAGRDSASYLSAICSAFATSPEACKQTVSTTPPGPGFGFDSVGSAQAAGCGT